MHRYLLILILLASACLLSVPMVGWLNPSIAEENGLMENIQLILVLLFIVVLLLRLRGAERDLRAVFYCGIAFGFGCAVREIDVRELDVPRWVELLGTGIGSDIIISALFLAIVFFAIMAGVSLKRKALRIPGLPFGMLGIAAVLGMLAGNLFEETGFGGDRSQMYEEYFETFAYFLMLTAALSADSLRSISGVSNETRSPKPLLQD